jgi:dTDP-4-dehydrorhamnose reductase
MSDKIIILGGTGMLGNKVVAEAAKRGYSVIAPRREHLNLMHDPPIDMLFHSNPSAKAVINCAGITPSHTIVNEMIRINSIVPYKITQWAEHMGIRVLHISTDCVFSGNSGYNPVERNPDPIDIYGRSKLLGEVKSEWVSNIRTSFIGLESGLLAWLIANKGQKIDGWSEAYWTGTSNTILSKALLDIVDHNTHLKNIEHFAVAKGESKYDLLWHLNKALKLDCEITPVKEPKIFRALHPTRILPSIEEAVEGIAREYFAVKVA